MQHFQQPSQHPGPNPQAGNRSTLKAGGVGRPPFPRGNRPPRPGESQQEPPQRPHDFRPPVGRGQQAFRPDRPQKPAGAPRQASFPMPPSQQNPGLNAAPLSAELKRKAMKNHQIISLAFLLYLILFFLLFLINPREAESAHEKRSLTQRPALSFEAIFSGDYGRQYEAYVADQFPFRDYLIGTHQRYNRLLSQAGAGSGPQIITAKKDDGGKGEMAQLLPENTASSPSEAVENHPEESSSPEAEASRQRPHDIHMTELAGSSQQEIDYETTNLIIDGGRAMEIFYFNEGLNIAYADRVNWLRKQLPEETRLISMVVPTAIAFYGNSEFREGDRSTFSAISTIYDHLYPSIYKVDAYSELAQHLDEYIYFRTDHHWNGRGAYYGYRAFCRALDLEPTPLEEMKTASCSDTFLGTLYAYTQDSPLLLNSADRAEFYYPKHLGRNFYYSNSQMDDGIENVLLNPDVPQDNQYLLYIGGDTALNLISSDLKNGRSILVIKDSYANAFVPYLTDHYENVYVVDPRSFEDPLIPFIKEKGINDVLMMNYSFAVSNPSWLEGYDRMVGFTE